MSKITGVWKRALQPLLLTAVRRQLGLGVPTPRTATTIAAIPTGLRDVVEAMVSGRSGLSERAS